MRSFAKALIATTPLLLVSGAAFAAGGMNECANGLDATCGKAIGIHFVNFVILFGGLFLVARKPVGELLKQRQAEIKKEITDAQEARNVAQERFDELEARLARFEQQVEQMKTDAKAAADRDAALHHERTMKDIELIKEQTTRAIREESTKAHRRLREQAVDLALEVATERLKGQLTTDDHKRLNQEFLLAVNPGAADA
ncbi:MAG: ATP synthase F0 subunit B [Myxococcota bacterium]|nr:ATP synthase F0 subunit B [Myxococcota bacterium]